MRIGDFKLGKVDGKDEYLLDDDSHSAFYDAFLIPDNIKISDFKSREYFFITGFRGTGKTSLLRYMLHNIQPDYRYRSIILFKSDIEEERRIKISNNVGYQIGNIDSNKMGIAQDFKSAWMWFILDKIGKKIIEFPTCCEVDDNYKKFITFMGLAGNNPYKKVLGFLPRLEGSNIKISGDISIFKAVVDLEFEKENSTSATALFSEVVSSALELLIKINFKEHLVFGIDELEVFYIRPEQYQRDLSMVRDLVFSIDRLNKKMRAKDVNILLIAAIRREVVDAIGPMGQEVNRVIHDRGANLSWHHAQKSLKHPLIEMIRRKLKRSIKGDYEGDPIIDFFDSSIDGESLDTYLLDRSFYRPRDIMWRLTFAQKNFPNEKKFGSKSLKETESDYSAQLWSEVEYELSATYSSDDISAITSIFSGISRLFFIKDLENIADSKSRHSKRIKEFIHEHSLADVCVTLYSHGALGNDFRTGSTGSISRNRWIFRGDHNLLIDNRMTLNPAVRKALSAIDRRKRGARGGVGLRKS